MPMTRIRSSGFDSANLYKFKVENGLFPVEKDGQHMYVSAELLTDPGIAGVRASVYFMINDPSGEVEPAKEHLEYKFTRKVSCHGCN
jgi:hypothetical protein